MRGEGFAIDLRFANRKSPSSSAALALAGVFDAEPGPGLDLEARLADGLAGAFADAVGAVLDLGQGRVDLAEQVAVFLDEAQGELLLVVIGAHVGHMDGQGGEVGPAAAAERFA